MKKIMFIVSTWQEAYFRAIVEGMKQYIRDRDVALHIFNAYGAAIEYYNKETEIFELPDMKQFDGALVMLNSENTNPYMERLVEKCRECGLPLLSIDRYWDGVAYCGIDNYTSFYDLTEHMIEEHGCRRLHFIGGPEDHPDTIERYQAFLACLSDHDLEPYGVGYYGYMRSSGRAAYEQIKNSGKPFADAYVCANDFAALGFVAAAGEDGKRVPDVFRVTGFDNLEEAQRNVPAITSMDRNLSSLGYHSIETLLKMVSGEHTNTEVYVPGKLCKSVTCGCQSVSDLSEKYVNMNRMMQHRDDLNDVQRKCRELLCGNHSFEEYQENLQRCNHLYGIGEILIGVNKSRTSPESSQNIIHQENYDHQIILYGLYEKVEQNRLESGLLIPSFEKEEEQIYLYESLHCKERTLGYSVFHYRPELFDFQFHRTLNETVAMAVENVRQTLILNQTNQKLESLYIKDSMTGLYNRFGYNSFAGDLFKENQGKIYVTYIDMDNLKQLNDNYGHDIGDIALKGIANAIRAVYTDTDIQVRMGGDEFLVMGRFVSEDELLKKEEKISEFLDHYSKEYHLPERLEVSIGHSFNEQTLESTGLESLIRVADTEMYRIKQDKKEKRKKHESE